VKHCARRSPNSKDAGSGPRRRSGRAAFVEPVGQCRRCPAGNAEETERLREATRQKIIELPSPRQNCAIRGRRSRAGRRAHAEAETHGEARACGRCLRTDPRTAHEPSRNQRGSARRVAQEIQADEITPQDYHTERAKILAEP